MSAVDIGTAIIAGVGAVAVIVSTKRTRKVFKDALLNHVDEPKRDSKKRAHVH